MCLDIQSWIEGGRLTPSLHARFPLHNNDYPPVLLSCRVAIKQCLHLVTMVRHIVFILEHAPKGTVLPPSARADVTEKLELLKACITNMRCSAMHDHPYLAKYIQLLLLGATAELRNALDERPKALSKALRFCQLISDNPFPFVDLVFYANRVFDILMQSGSISHAYTLMHVYASKFAGLKDVDAFVLAAQRKLEQAQHKLCPVAPTGDHTSQYFTC